jgi:maltose alpha-D-glucosyltransferase/alpha-amylase
LWSDDPSLYHEARIIFIDTHVSNWAWDDVANQYYWHRFFDHQPDLNYDNPGIREAMKDVLRYWLSLGFDGLRLDAVPYLFEREGTNGENLPDTHAYLKELRAMVDAEFPGRILLAEANQWPEDVVAYYGDGDECHMAFHFPVMPRLYMALELEDATPITGILERTPPIPDSSQWGTFLRNHDELTLEMVTEEERAFMYERYAPDPKMRKNLGIRRRLAPLLGGDRRKIELLNGLLLSLPGSPFLYYGDEIGMGDEYLLEDRDGVRTPMQWDDSPGAGFSHAPLQTFYLPLVTDPEYSPDKVNVAAQVNDENSLLSWTKRMLDTRRGHPALSLGSFRPLTTESAAALCFLREHEDDRVLVAANLCRRRIVVPLLDLEGTWRDVTLPDVVWSYESPLRLPPYSFRWLAPAD